MSDSDTTLIRSEFAKLLSAAREAGLPDDLTGRLILSEVLGLWQETRSWQDVASELQFTSEQLDPDLDHEFMRP